MPFAKWKTTIIVRPALTRDDIPLVEESSSRLIPFHWDVLRDGEWEYLAGGTQLSSLQHTYEYAATNREVRQNWRTQSVALLYAFRNSLIFPA